MTETDLACLKSNVDKLVEIETVRGERLTAKVICVFDGEDNADVFYKMIPTSTPEFYSRHLGAGGYSLLLSEIVSVKPAQ
jgi:hypothetical protein